MLSPVIRLSSTRRHETSPKSSAGSSPRPHSHGSIQADPVRLGRQHYFAAFASNAQKYHSYSDSVVGKGHLKQMRVSSRAKFGYTD